MTEGQISTQVENGIGSIEFYHPAGNSLPGTLLHELASSVEAMDNEASVRVIVLRSRGERAFCAGASFDELLAVEDMDGGKRFFSGFAKVINAMRRSSKLIIGRVQGKTVGGGVGLASAVDYCLATEAASVKLSELAIGIGPFVVGPAVERKIGLSAMSQLAIDASSWYPAQWAREKGLFTHVFEDIESMDAACAALAEKLAGSNPEAMAHLKRIFWAGTEHWDELLTERAAISGELVLSDFTRNAIASFKAQKR